VRVSSFLVFQKGTGVKPLTGPISVRQKGGYSGPPPVNNKMPVLSTLQAKRTLLGFSHVNKTKEVVSLYIMCVYICIYIARQHDRGGRRFHTYIFCFFASQRDQGGWKPSEKIQNCFSTYSAIKRARASSTKWTLNQGTQH
jgi:hypothetical protein